MTAWMRSATAHARNHHFSFQLGSLTNINRETQTLQLAQICDEQGGELVPARELPYDILVMALGSTSNDFGTPGVKEHCIFWITRIRRVASTTKCSTCS